MMLLYENWHKSKTRMITSQQVARQTKSECERAQTYLTTHLRALDISKSPSLQAFQPLLLVV
jgi:hypothetical protein